MEDLAPVDEFYKRLFEFAPEVQPMFKREMGPQAKKFSDMLAWGIAHLEHPDELCSEMRALGARHRDYGVEIDHTRRLVRR